MSFAVHTLPVRDEGGDIIGGMVMTQDITERERFEAELLHQALYDRLTGLPNRTLFYNRLGHALDRLRRGGAGSCAVLFLDLDQLKVSMIAWGIWRVTVSWSLWGSASLVPSVHRIRWLAGEAMSLPC